jgi:UPF0755 protein
LKALLPYHLPAFLQTLRFTLRPALRRTPQCSHPHPHQRGGFVLRALLLLAVAAAALAAAVWWWSRQPLVLPPDAKTVDVVIESGSTSRSIAQAVAGAGVRTVGAGASPGALYWWFRLSRKAPLFKAGSYELDARATPQSLIAKFVKGEQALRTVTFVEGWTWKQVREALQKAEYTKPDSLRLTDAQIMARVGKPGVAPEGRFLPETYAYAKGASDITVLLAAARAMDKQLAAAWDARQPDLPLKTPDDALTLASIVEKETGKPSDRAEIGGVFINRLRIGMLLQTDPTVIYGLGDKFDGNLRKRDLQTDTPFNTYTRAGLPPTPIAMPGKAALLAATQPASTKALYFVARGDGSSQFSASLDEHNRAVNKFIRGQ